MNPETLEAARWERARELFLDLADLPPAERGPELERIGAEDPELRAWVERLLAQDLGSGPEEAEQSGERRRYGPYETLHLIATGGMGEVHLARRVDGAFERLVAVKLLRPGFPSEELVQRFLRERRTLARLDHEYVAKLLDGGTTEDGQPFLVMEYVDGRPLDAYVEEEELDVQGRLELFRRVLDAVAHAHGRGVMHRDLKPSNILVRADGTPRLLDFGIARPREDAETAEGPLTRTGHRLFTPEYGAPEQVQGEEPTESTDVFALGVVLYELLTGRRPWPEKKTPVALELAILQHEPAPPSRARRATTTRRPTRRTLARDLDTIVLTCLQKRPEARYRNAAELAADLDRYLTGLPILARRTGLLGRAWRYARRQPWRAGSLAAALVALAAVGIAWRVSAESERRRVELERSVAAQVNASRVLREQGRLDDAELELREALAALHAVPDAIVLRATVLGQLAVLANHQRRYDDALARIAEARAALPEGRAEAPELEGSLLNSRSFALAASGRRDEAWESAQAALAHCRATLPPGHELTVDALIEISEQQRWRGDGLAGLDTLAEAVAEARAGEDPRDEGLGRVLNLRGLMLVAAGRFGEALEAYGEALEILGWHFGEGHLSIAQLRENIGEARFHTGEYARAEEEHRRALTTFRALKDFHKVGRSLDFMGQAALADGRAEEARAHFEEALAVRREHLGERHAETRRSRYWLGVWCLMTGDVPGARRLLGEALDDSLWDGPLSPNYRRDAAQSLAHVGPGDER